MSWFNVDDKAHSSDQFRQAGLDGFGLFAAGGSYAMEKLTDGFVPLWFVQSWGTGGTRAAKKLVAAKLWAPSQKDGLKGYQFVEWKEALTRKYVMAARKKDADRKKAKAADSEGDSEADSMWESDWKSEAESPSDVGSESLGYTNHQPPTTNGTSSAVPTNRP